MASATPQEDFEIEIQEQVKGFSWPRRALRPDPVSKRTQSSAALGVLVLLIGILAAAGMTALGFLLALILDVVVS